MNAFEARRQIKHQLNLIADYIPEFCSKHGVQLLNPRLEDVTENHATIVMDIQGKAAWDLKLPRVSVRLEPIDT